MKIKHNKKRNTLFLYEVLIRQLAKTIINKSLNEKKEIIGLLKNFFGKNCILRKELDLARQLLESTDFDSKMIEKLTISVRESYNKLNRNNIFQEQSKLISKINKNLNNSILFNFVPNYKSLATIYQFLNTKNNKERIILENKIVDSLTNSLREKKELEPLTNLQLKCFLNKFNQQYSNDLLNEQKELLYKYITSFSDNLAELKIYINEEIWRLRENLENSLSIKEISDNDEILNKTKQVIQMLENCKNKVINNELLKEILKIQQLVHEVNSEE